MTGEDETPMDYEIRRRESERETVSQLRVAEARIRELEAERDAWKALAENGAQALPRYVTRATAAEAKLARFETAAKIYRDDGDCQDFRDALAALQQEGE